MVIVSGFSERYSGTTARCYARNVKIPGAPWRRVDDFPISVGITHSALAVDGMKLYMCGGYVPTRSENKGCEYSYFFVSEFSSRFVGGHPGPDTDVCFVYDHSIAPGNGQQWQSMPSLPDGRSGGGLVLSKRINALIYSGGAKRPSAAQYDDFPHTWILPLNGGSGWRRSTDIPFLSNHKSSVTAIDERGAERHYFLGGQERGNENGGNVADNYEFDPVNEVWIKRHDMIFGRGHSSESTLHISCGYVIMAGTANDGKTKEIHYYDIPSDSWTRIGEFPAFINTPVCAIDYENGMLYCETGYVSGRFSEKIKIEV
jgi:hypothetical protein